MHRRDSLAAGCSGHRGRRLPGERTRTVRVEKAWTHASPGLLRNSPGSAGRRIPASEFDSSCLECGPPIRCLPTAARDWLDGDVSPSGVPEGGLGSAAGLSEPHRRSVLDVSGLRVWIAWWRGRGRGAEVHRLPLFQVPVLTPGPERNGVCCCRGFGFWGCPGYHGDSPGVCGSRVEPGGWMSSRRFRSWASR